MDFSILYFVDGAAAAFRKGGPERLEELTDEPVGVLRGTTTAQVAERALGARAPRARLVLFDSHPEGLEALERGDIEAYMGDRSILLYQMGRMRPGVPPVMGAARLSREPYALALPLGESRLRLAVDRALSRLYGTGEIWSLIRESLGRVEIDPAIEAIYEVVAIPE
jgi:polar amino acid transport system substrate-binding protein/glutamate/aspartate transport system substrate-binding protein